jgi:hypothetical protein
MKTPSAILIKVLKKLEIENSVYFATYRKELVIDGNIDIKKFNKLWNKESKQ